MGGADLRMDDVWEQIAFGIGRRNDERVDDRLFRMRMPSTRCTVRFTVPVGSWAGWKPKARLIAELEK